MANYLVGMRRVDRGEGVLVRDLLASDNKRVCASKLAFDLLQGFYLSLAVLFFAKVDERLVLKWRLSACCGAFDGVFHQIHSLENTSSCRTVSFLHCIS